MSDKIEPALTPEEWRLARLWHAGKMPGGKVRGMVVLDLPETHRHGAAALALYGQPFGFTREDIGELDDVVEIAENEGFSCDAVRRIRDRIEALLPPQDAEP